MKNLWLAILFFTLNTSICTAQYYLRGEVHSVDGKPLSNVKILLSSKGDYPYYSGNAGAFGIPSSLINDTITLSYEGLETIKMLVSASKLQSFTMQPAIEKSSANSTSLISLTKNKPKYDAAQFFSDESYTNTVENSFIDAKPYPETGFALNVDCASYSNIRRFINTEGEVPPDAVRIEEMLNYFDLRNKNLKYPRDTFSFETHLTSVPWQTQTKNQLLFINMQAPKLNLDSVRQSNFIFLIDVSGSMDDPKRLPLLQSAFKMLEENLRAKDSVAIVVYGGSVRVVLQPTSAAQKQTIIQAIESLTANGETPGGAAIQRAYDLAERSFNRLANNRIILATDGDFNVGQTSEKELEDLIVRHKQSGIYLTCLGVGMGNYKDSKLEALANKGNGNFAYLDNLQEAEKVLIKEFTKTLYAVADDAFLSIEFNPALVKDYRLIGFDNKKDALADSSSMLEGGEVGSGHSMLAVFEIIPAKDGALSKGQTIASLKLQYKMPVTQKNIFQKFGALNNLQPIEETDSCYRFGASVIMFGELLKHSDFAKNYSWNDVEKVAASSADINDISQREFLSLTDKASKIYTPVKSRRKKKDDEE